ncbi:TonB-dependent receptor domain-containing protein [Photorhabdus sp. RM323S]|uniref:TonB-dependent receptor n=1 Tax=Photorhabdus sp. RM323S TaxID=3342828 RepID=UPI0036D9F238
MPYHANCQRSQPRWQKKSLTALLLPLILLSAQPIYATTQTETIYSVDIPAGTLGSSLSRFAAQTGTAFSFDPKLTNGLTAPSLSGSFTAHEGLVRLLTGSHLRLSQRTDGSYTLVKIVKNMTNNGAIILSPLAVTGSRGYSGNEPLRFNSTTIRGKDIEKFGVIHPVDIFKTTPGILSGEARSSGSLDVNIRGLQGQGRVLTTVDGASNQTALYRGYQGVSNRSFIDPDFIGRVDISKGPTGKGGMAAIGGVVEIKTIEASDILLDGQNIGWRLKGSLLNNHSNPDDYQRNDWPSPSKTAFLDAKNRTGSVVFAVAEPSYELLFGISQRKRGNYHSGKHGPGAKERGMPGYLCQSDPQDCHIPQFSEQMAGYSLYAMGDAVPNTSEDSQSLLGKGKIRFGDGHEISAIVSHYQNLYGESYVADMANLSQTFMILDQGPLTRLNMNRHSLNYKWEPASNPWVNLDIGVWQTRVNDRPRTSNNTLGDKKFMRTVGINLSNTSLFELSMQDIELNYGASFIRERTGPSKGKWEYAVNREGERKEGHLFLNGSYMPAERFTLMGGWDFKSYQVEDYSPSHLGNAWLPQLTSGKVNNKQDHAHGYWVGTKLELNNTTALHAKYAYAPRFPSMVEGIRGYLMSVDDHIKPEISKNIELGLTSRFLDVIADNDSFDIKISYFDNRVKDYINRSWMDDYWSMYISNIKAAKFAGLELASVYHSDHFDARLSMNYYTKVRFCTENEGCVARSLPSDYATNHIPPKYAVSLDLTRKFFDDKMSINARVSHYGQRSVPAAKPGQGSALLLSPIIWRPATVADVSLTARANKHVEFEFGVDNVFDKYYIQPLSLGYLPSPGRTFRAGITTYF